MQFRFLQARAAIAALALPALAFPAAVRATTLVRDGFDTTVYSVGTDGTGKLHGKGSSETGFASSAKWASGDSSVVKCLSDGLAFPSAWDGFATAGAGAIGYRNTGTSGNGTVGNSNSDYRAGQRALAADALPATGTYYLRALMRQGSGAGAATRVEGMMRGVGLRTQGINGLAGGNPSHGRLESGNALTNGVWFAFRKTSASDSSADTEVVLRFGGATQTLVGAEAFAEGVTYLCVAEISVGENGATARAFATAIDDYDNQPDALWGEKLQTGAISAAVPFTHLCMTAPYMTDNATVAFDEIAVATELSELVPTTVSEFSVYPIAAELSPALDGFSVPIVIDLPEGETADVVVEYGTSESDLSSSCAVLSDASSGRNVANATGLEPDMEYFWRLRATAAGHDDAVSSIQAFRTLGAPILGATSATLDGASVLFSAELATPALDGAENPPETELFVTYTVAGVPNTVSLGRLSAPGTLSYAATDVSWGENCTYSFSATANDGSRDYSSTTADSTIAVRTAGTVYVSDDGSGTAPYDTLEKAANTVAAAVAVAGDGATVRIAPGTYETSERVVLDRNVRVEGMTGKPADVVVRNVGSSPACRVFNLTHSGAVLADLTVADGHIVGFTGGNLWISNGTVTNCIVENATLSWTTADANNEHGGAGVYMRAGRLVNCIVRGNAVTGTAVKDQATGVLAKGSSVIQNCLFEGNDSELEAAVVHLAENAHMINCTIVRSTLGAGTDLNGGSASIRIASSLAYVQNCAVAGVVDANGTTLTPLDGSGGTTERFANIANSAFDFAFDEALATSKGWVRGTAATMFAGYAARSYRPSPGGPLVNAGKNNVTDALPALDLAGNERLFGSAYDIGCYELQAHPTVMVFR